MRWLLFIILLLPLTLAQEVTPFLVSPFDGDYIMGAVFDHDIPNWEVESGGTLLAWWGEEIGVGYDGHNGYDWTMPIGTPIYAASEGVVKFAGTTEPHICPSKGIMVEGGQFVRIRHEVEGQIFYTNYAHLDSFVVAEGNTVEARQLIGYSGQTGTCAAPHLHFDVDKVFEDGHTVNIDPYGWKGLIGDPWGHHSEGVRSFNMWKLGKAPKLYREISYQPEDALPFYVTTIRFIGVNDRNNPSNEFVELTLNPGISERFSLAGFQLVSDKGDTFVFPSGSFLELGKPVRVYTAQGTDSRDEFFWNERSGIWGNNGFCLSLKQPDGKRFMTYSEQLEREGCQ
jgi:murein DD-endopeptidase MepM/ murein hydrolase activator NlpD